MHRRTYIPLYIHIDHLVYMWVCIHSIREVIATFYNHAGELLSVQPSTLDPKPYICTYIPLYIHRYHTQI